MFGKNPKRPPEKGNGTILSVQHIFATIQGEGPHAGVPAVFVRLGGCNLACNFCDTEFESFKEMQLGDIIGEVIRLAKYGEKLVVITGGEPLRQPIEAMCDALLNADFDVQIETNGTLYRELDKRVDIICSPKNTGEGYADIRDDLMPRVTALKFLISAHNDDYKKVPEVGQRHYNTPVYLQPMDVYDIEKNKENHEYTSQLVKQHGVRFSVQLHKILGIE